MNLPALALLALCAFTLCELWRAPLGWQDDRGFHYGSGVSR